MMSAISGVPKGASKTIPAEAEPPAKEDIEEMLKNESLNRSGDIEDGEEEDMHIDKAKRSDEVVQALVAADALGKASETGNGTIDVTDPLRELDMDHYDDEDDGIELFSTGLGDTYYTSNDMDPYLKDKDDDDDEELEDMTIKPSDSVIVCASNEDDVSQLQACVKSMNGPCDT